MLCRDACKQNNNNLLKKSKLFFSVSILKKAGVEEAALGVRDLSVFRSPTSQHKLQEAPPPTCFLRCPAEPHSHVLLETSAGQSPPPGDSHQGHHEVWYSRCPGAAPSYAAAQGSDDPLPPAALKSPAPDLKSDSTSYHTLQAPLSQSPALLSLSACTLSNLTSQLNVSFTQQQRNLDFSQTCLKSTSQSLTQIHIWV